MPFECERTVEKTDESVTNSLHLRIMIAGQGFNDALYMKQVDLML
jgi:hypothetical protein